MDSAQCNDPDQPAQSAKANLDDTFPSRGDRGIE